MRLRALNHLATALILDKKACRFGAPNFFLDFLLPLAGVSNSARI